MDNTFKKPTQIRIEVLPYISNLLKDGLVKDLQENEIICPVCEGTGLALSDAVYGLKNDPVKTSHFPYKKQYVTNCQHLFGRCQCV